MGSRPSSPLLSLLPSSPPSHRCHSSLTARRLLRADDQVPCHDVSLFTSEQPACVRVLNACPPCSSQQAFLLENVPCTNASCEGAHRMFRVCWELTDLSHIREAQVATFFDIYEDVSPRRRV